VLKTLRCCSVLFFTASLILGANATTSPKKHSTPSTQMRPSADRIAEIKSALKAHGYEPGSTWEETQTACRKIADEHGWQTDHAPDARVLILFGLAGPHSDPAVAQMPGGRLDHDQRAEATRRSLKPAVTTAENLKPPAQIQIQKRKTAVRSKNAAKKRLSPRASKQV
jgi:hypothetical protein